MTKRDDDSEYCRSVFLSNNKSSPKVPTRLSQCVMSSKRLMVPAVLIAFAFSLSSCRGWWFWTPGDSVDNAGYHPDQPVQFTHNKHAGERKIPCQYCHSSARRSSTAGIPPTNTCMGCHKIVGTQLDEIKYITAQYEANKPIPWKKVHDLPDFVRFPHKSHIAAKIDCAECHGAVEEMGTVKQVAPLQMGWCVSCHQEKGASLDCQACHY